MTLFVAGFWTKKLFVADFMDSDTICGRFNGLRYYLWQV